MAARFSASFARRLTMLRASEGSVQFGLGVPVKSLSSIFGPFFLLYGDRNEEGAIGTAATCDRFQSALADRADSTSLN
jgi:hypothetical protein